MEDHPPRCHKRQSPYVAVVVRLPRYRGRPLPSLPWTSDPHVAIYVRTPGYHGRREI